VRRTIEGEAAVLIDDVPATDRVEFEPMS